MKIASVKEIQELDQKTINDLGIPSLVLMERAALGAFYYIKDKYPSILNSNYKALIVVGVGNNGGDGLALARILNENNKEVTVIIFSEEKCTPDNLTQLKICKQLGINILNYSYDELINSIKECDIIIDALFGVGLSREIEGEYQEVINEINLSNKPIISLDIPSGINGDTGQVMGIACKATATVTFALPKYGLLMDRAIDYVGDLCIVDIGIPKVFTKDLKGNLLDTDELKNALSKRKRNSHKGNYGKVFILTGSQTMSGAAILAGKSALLSGVGLVYIGVPECIRETVAVSLPGAIVVPLPQDSNGLLSETAYSKIAEYLINVDALAIGPGLGLSQEIERLIKLILVNFHLPIVIDADGLNNIANTKEIKLNSNITITPHPGELGKLLNLRASDIQQNRLFYVQKAVEEFNCNVVLKGSRTIISNICKDVWINTTGNPGMAKGGAGDVLTGLIGGLLARNYGIEALKLGVYWHGKAGDLAALNKGENCMQIEDLISYLPSAYNAIEKML